jgi:hypothetical protein
VIVLAIDGVYGLTVYGDPDEVEQELLLARKDERLARFTRPEAEAASTNLPCRIDPARVTHFTVYPESFAGQEEIKG